MFTAMNLNQNPRTEYPSSTLHAPTPPRHTFSSKKSFLYHTYCALGHSLILVWAIIRFNFFKLKSFRWNISNKIPIIICLYNDREAWVHTCDWTIILPIHCTHNLRKEISFITIYLLRKRFVSLTNLPNCVGIDPERSFSPIPS